MRIIRSTTKATFTPINLSKCQKCGRDIIPEKFLCLFCEVGEDDTSGSDRSK